MNKKEIFTAMVIGIMLCAIPCFFLSKWGIKDIRDNFISEGWFLMVLAGCFARQGIKFLLRGIKDLGELDDIS